MQVEVSLFFLSNPPIPGDSLLSCLMSKLMQKGNSATLTFLLHSGKSSTFSFFFIFLGTVLYIQDNFKPVIILPRLHSAGTTSILLCLAGEKLKTHCLCCLMPGQQSPIVILHHESSPSVVLLELVASRQGEVLAPQRVCPTQRMGVTNLQVAELHSIHHVLGNISRHLVYPSAWVGCALEQEMTISNTEPSHSCIPLYEDLSYPRGH